MFVEPLIIQPFPKQALIFTCLQYKSFENTVREGEIDRKEQFLLSHSVFNLLVEHSTIFTQLKNCSLQTLTAWKGLKFAV